MSSRNNATSYNNSPWPAAVASLLVLLLLFGLIAGYMAGMPKYRLWKAGIDRQQLVVQANAEAEAARSYAQAEIERAIGVAESNRIVADSLTPEYLRYHYINTLSQNDQNVIYIPTEAGLPILEAGHREAVRAGGEE